VFCVLSGIAGPFLTLHSTSLAIEVRIMYFLQRNCVFDNIMTLLSLVMWCKLAVSLKDDKHLLPPSPIHARKLQSGIPYNVQIFLSLDYLNDTIAVLFESANTTSSNDVTSHFCFAVNFQVSLAQTDAIHCARLTLFFHWFYTRSQVATKLLITLLWCRQ
jgi:hypothetical protein